MTSRKDYIELMSERLDEVNAELKVLQAKAKEAGKTTAAKISAMTDAAKPRIAQDIKYLKAKQKDLEVRIKGLKGPSKAAWEDLSTAIDLAWKDLKKGVVSASKHFQENAAKPRSKAKKRKVATKGKAAAKKVAKKTAKKAPAKSKSKAKKARPKTSS